MAIFFTKESQPSVHTTMTDVASSRTRAPPASFTYLLRRDAPRFNYPTTNDTAGAPTSALLPDVTNSSSSASASHRQHGFRGEQCASSKTTRIAPQHPSSWSDMVMVSKAADQMAATAKTTTTDAGSARRAAAAAASSRSSSDLPYNAGRPSPRLLQGGSNDRKRRRAEGGGHGRSSSDDEAASSQQRRAHERRSRPVYISSTGFTPAEVVDLDQQATRLGLRYDGRLTSATRVLIVAPASRASEKFLAAKSKGIPMVAVDWLLSSGGDMSRLDVYRLPVLFGQTVCATMLSDGTPPESPMTSSYCSQAAAVLEQCRRLGATFTSVLHKRCHLLVVGGPVDDLGQSKALSDKTLFARKHNIGMMSAQAFLSLRGSSSPRGAEGTSRDGSGRHAPLRAAEERASGGHISVPNIRATTNQGQGTHSESPSDNLTCEAAIRVAALASSASLAASRKGETTTTNANGGVSSSTKHGRDAEATSTSTASTSSNTVLQRVFVAPGSLGSCLCYLTPPHAVTPQVKQLLQAAGLRRVPIMLPGVTHVIVLVRSFECFGVVTEKATSASKGRDHNAPPATCDFRKGVEGPHASFVTLAWVQACIDEAGVAPALDFVPPAGHVIISPVITAAAYPSSRAAPPVAPAETSATNGHDVPFANSNGIPLAASESPSAPPTKAHLLDAVTQLGGRVQDTLVVGGCVPTGPQLNDNAAHACRSTTHVVIGDVKLAWCSTKVRALFERQATRGGAPECLVVQREWVVCSVAAGRWLNPAPYAVRTMEELRVATVTPCASSSDPHGDTRPPTARLTNDVCPPAPQAPPLLEPSVAAAKAVSEANREATRVAAVLLPPPVTFANVPPPPVAVLTVVADATVGSSHSCSSSSSSSNGVVLASLKTSSAGAITRFVRHRPQPQPAAAAAYPHGVAADGGHRHTAVPPPLTTTTTTAPPLFLFPASVSFDDGTSSPFARVPPPLATRAAALVPPPQSTGDELLQVAHSASSDPTSSSFSRNRTGTTLVPESICDLLDDLDCAAGSTGSPMAPGPISLSAPLMVAAAVPRLGHSCPSAYLRLARRGCSDSGVAHRQGDEGGAESPSDVHHHRSATEPLVRRTVLAASSQVVVYDHGGGGAGPLGSDFFSAPRVYPSAQDECPTSNHAEATGDSNLVVIPPSSVGPQPAPAAAARQRRVTIYMAKAVRDLPLSSWASTEQPPPPLVAGATVGQALLDLVARGSIQCGALADDVVDCDTAATVEITVTEAVAECTHVISHRPSKTETFLCAVAAGKWVLVPSFIAACHAAGKWLAEEPFEFSADRFTSSTTGDAAATAAAHCGNGVGAAVVALHKSAAASMPCPAISPTLLLLANACRYQRSHHSRERGDERPFARADDFGITVLCARAEQAHRLPSFSNVLAAGGAHVVVQLLLCGTAGIGGGGAPTMGAAAAAGYRVTCSATVARCCELPRPATGGAAQRRDISVGVSVLVDDSVVQPQGDTASLFAALNGWLNDFVASVTDSVEHPHPKPQPVAAASTSPNDIAAVVRQLRTAGFTPDAIVLGAVRSLRMEYMVHALCHPSGGGNPAAFAVDLLKWPSPSTAASSMPAVLHHPVPSASLFGLSASVFAVTASMSASYLAPPSSNR